MLSVSRHRRILCAFIALATSLSSCADSSPSIPSEVIDHQEPFGVSWSLHRDQITELANEGCSEATPPFPDNSNENITEGNNSNCAISHERVMFIPTQKLPNFFRNGWLSIVFEKEGMLAAIEYSFLHRAPHGSNWSEQRRRDEHTGALHKAIKDIYGPPLANGRYDQWSETGFVRTRAGNNPCNAWISDTTGILLCSKRVVLIDGLEMSLSFYNLERVPFGRDFAELVSGGTSKN